MCLHTKTGEILTAKADMKVWKVIGINNTAMFHYFRYAPYTLYRLRKALYLYESTVDRGFHSYIDRTKAEVYSGRKAYKIVEFTIPRGAKYCLGIDGDVVSTSIRSGSLDAISMQHS